MFVGALGVGVHLMATPTEYKHRSILTYNKFFWLNDMHVNKYE